MSTIYQATDRKDRRVELLETAVRDRAVVCAAERGNPPPQLRWLRHLDAEDRAECLAELWAALEDTHGGRTQEAFAHALHAWRTTALALADPDRREVLLGTVGSNDFELVARPQ